MSRVIDLPGPSWQIPGVFWLTSTAATTLASRYQGYFLGVREQQAKWLAMSRTLGENLAEAKAGIDGGLNEPRYLSIRGPQLDGSCGFHAVMPFTYRQLGRMTPACTFMIQTTRKQLVTTLTSRPVLTPGATTRSRGVSEGGEVTRREIGRNIDKRFRVFVAGHNSCPMGERPQPAWLAATTFEVTVSVDASLRIQDSEGRVTGNVNGQLALEYRAAIWICQLAPSPVWPLPTQNITL